jgi:hypothetical protein
MCLCGGVLETATLVAAGGYIVKKQWKIKLPSLATIVAGMRAGVRPGQVFKDKRRPARVNEKAQVKADAADHC